MRSLTALPIAALLLLVLATGCTESPPAQPAVTAPPATSSPATTATTLQVWTTHPTLPQTASVSDNTITIAKNTFRPANMTVKAGSTVRWVNADDHPHNIAFANKDFSASTFLLGSGQSSSQRFDRPGTYDFSCLIHPQMQGQIVVEA